MNISNKNNILVAGENPCSSCGVCALACPAQCITITINEDGFFRPVVDENVCTSCSICKKVCYKYLEETNPFTNYFHDKEVYGAWSKNDNTRITSSSGGVGHELVCKALNQGYKSCGAIFNVATGKVVHKIAETLPEALMFKTSKYLQSYTVDAFSQFKEQEKYLVVGTPCQIYGLRKWLKLKKLENNFILVDFFCHGTPSYLLWRKYAQYIKDKFKLDDFEEVNFRDKRGFSWHKNAMKILAKGEKTYYKNRAFSEDLFFKFFLSDTCLNDSCYQCLLRLDDCASDIRLADFWGLKYRDNEEGVTLVAINTEKGSSFFDQINFSLNVERSSFEDLQNSQPKRFLQMNTPKRRKVMSLLQGDENLKTIYRKTIWHIGKNIVGKIKQVAKQVLGENSLSASKKIIQRLI